jgi:hypothetical protein
LVVIARGTHGDAVDNVRRPDVGDPVEFLMAARTGVNRSVAWLSVRFARHRTRHLFLALSRHLPVLFALIAGFVG